MTSFSKIFFVLVFSVILLSFGGCRKKNVEILFDESEPLALAPDVSWALVVEPYVAYRNTSSWDAQVTGHSRKGTVIQVLGYATTEKDGNWYLFESGWLSEDDVDVYNNMLRAKKAAESLK